MDNQPVNGAEVDTPLTPPKTAIQNAQDELCAALMAMPLNPQGAAASAFVTAVMQSARLTAVIQFLIGLVGSMQEAGIQAHDKSWTTTEFLESMIAEELRKSTEQYKAQAASLRQAAPRLVMPGQH